jgi:hypothetical protein
MGFNFGEQVLFKRQILKYRLDHVIDAVNRFPDIDARPPQVFALAGHEVTVSDTVMKNLDTLGNAHRRQPARPRRG